ncbi:MAG: hypothetical protein WBG71_01905 [Leeuwenhoekiella sp.]
MNGELLFFRCNQSQLSHPYNISLIDLSHNRNFCRPETYKPDDVLWNTDENKNFQKYIDKSVVRLELIIQPGANTISKRFYSSIDDTHFVDIVLKHKPLYCNQAHSAFEVSYNRTIVTWDNWDDTLGLKNGLSKRVVKELRNDIRQFLTKMIISESASNNGFELVS